MSTVQEIKQAIQLLPKSEFWELAEWFDERRADEWDRQIETDAKAGKLDRFAEEAIREYRSGKTRPLP
ncbi:MAG: hypothetical protein KGS61_02300 [Verrucomicrobia bacterium]|nr:hypothetical protein [Verrucomicrobiota bacterium]